MSDIPKERIDGPAALFVRPGALGPGLIRVEPVFDGERTPAIRLGAIVVEQLLGEVRMAPGASDTFVLSTSLVPVSLSTRVGVAPAVSPYTFVIPASGGQLLVVGEVDPADLAAARGQLARRDARHDPVDLRCHDLARAPARSSTCAVERASAARSSSSRPRLSPRSWPPACSCGSRQRPSNLRDPPTAPLDLFLTALFFAALVWTVLNVIERRRVAPPRIRVLADSSMILAGTVVVSAAAGAIDAAILWRYQGFLRGVVAQAPLDLLHFSLHPLIPVRLVMAFGLVLLHAAVVWSAAIVIRLATVMWRRPRSATLTAAAVISWLAGVEIVVGLARWLSAPQPLGPLFIAVAAVGACAAALGAASRARRGERPRRPGLARCCWPC